MSLSKNGFIIIHESILYRVQGRLWAKKQCTELRATQNQASWKTSKEAITKHQIRTIYFVCGYLCQQSGTIAFGNGEVWCRLNVTPPSSEKWPEPSVLSRQWSMWEWALPPDVDICIGIVAAKYNIEAQYIKEFGMAWLSQVCAGLFEVVLFKGESVVVLWKFHIQWCLWNCSFVITRLRAMTQKGVQWNAVNKSKSRLVEVEF